MNLKQAGILGFYAGAAVGGGVAWFLTNRHLRMRYEEIAEREIAEARQFFERHYKTKSPTQMAEELGLVDVQSDEGQAVAQAIEDLGYTPKVDPDDPGEIMDFRKPADDVDTIHGRPERRVEHHSVFTENQWDWAHEMEYRAQQPGVPYVINSDEWEADEPVHEKVSMTYWADDHVLADDQEKNVPDPDSIVGIHNLDKFGYGSDDPNVVYVRNDKMSMDFDIHLQTGSYAKIVLGFDDSLEHADRPRNRGPRRFRE